MIDWANLTWTCHVCGDERPDPFISVLSTKRTTLNNVELQENVRYCNDRSECIEGAKHVSWIGEGT